MDDDESPGKLGSERSQPLDVRIKSESNIADRMSLPWFCLLGHSELLQEYADGLDGTLETLLQLCAFAHGEFSEHVQYHAVDTLIGLLPTSNSVLFALATSNSCQQQIIRSIAHSETAASSSVCASSSSGSSSSVSGSWSAPDLDPVEMHAAHRGESILLQIKPDVPGHATYLHSHMSRLLGHSACDPLYVFTKSSPLFIRRGMSSSGLLLSMIDRVDFLSKRLAAQSRTIDGMELAGLLTSLLRFCTLGRYYASDEATAVPSSQTDPASGTEFNAMGMSPFHEDRLTILFGGLSHQHASKRSSSAPSVSKSKAGKEMEKSPHVPDAFIPSRDVPFDPIDRELALSIGSKDLKRLTHSCWRCIMDVAQNHGAQECISSPNKVGCKRASREDATHASGRTVRSEGSASFPIEQLHDEIALSSASLLCTCLKLLSFHG